MHENVNRGWRAELNGTKLRSITVDGWQQGYVVPANDGGTVALTFTPDGSYRRALLVGLVAALVLLAVAFGGRRVPVVVGASFDDGSSSGLDELAPTPDRRDRRDLVIPLVTALVVGTMLSAFAGLAAAAIVVTVMARRRLVVLAVAVPCLIAGAVAVARASGAQPGTGAGSFSALAQILTAIAVAVAAGVGLQAGPDDRPSRVSVPPGAEYDPAPPSDQSAA